MKVKQVVRGSKWMEKRVRCIQTCGGETTGRRRMFGRVVFGLFLLPGWLAMQPVAYGYNTINADFTDTLANEGLQSYAQGSSTAVSDSAGTLTLTTDNTSWYRVGIRTISGNYFWHDAGSETLTYEFRTIGLPAPSDQRTVTFFILGNGDSESSTQPVYDSGNVLGIELKGDGTYYDVNLYLKNTQWANLSSGSLVDSIDNAETSGNNLTVGFTLDANNEIALFAGSTTNTTVDLDSVGIFDISNFEYEAYVGMQAQGNSSGGTTAFTFSSFEVSVPPVLPDVVYVDASVGSSGAGTNWATAFKTIQEGVDAVSSTGTVWVTNGVYDTGSAVTPGGVSSNRVVITSAITVQSVNGPEVTTIAGGGVFASDTGIRGVYMTNGCTLGGFTITNGNTLTSAGDMIPDWSGGGVWLSAGCVVSNCIIKANRSQGYGGGALAYGGGLLLNCQIVTNHSAFDGGGVCLYGSGEAANCLVRDCVAENTGGGIYLYDGSVMDNCTVVRNTANDGWGSGEDAGVHCEDSAINNSIIMLSSSTRNLKRVNSDVRYTDTTDDISAGVDGCIAENPLFVDIAGNDFTLQSESPCKNTGDNTYAPTNVSPVDLAGNPRIVNSIVDMGAYEVQAALPATYYVDASRPDDSGAGTNWATAKQTIQAGVDAVSSTGTVWVTNGVYDVGGMVTPGYALTNRVCITNNITVRSVNGADVTFIKGASGSNGSNDVDAVRGVFMTAGTLSGFTVTNGYTMATGSTLYDRSGGGLWITNNCVVSNLVVSGSGASRDGGGVYLCFGGMMDSCILSGNRSDTGGGAAFDSGGTMDNCLLQDNVADVAGGAYLYDNGTMNNCTLVGNSARAVGGVSFDSGGTLNNCIVYQNSTTVSAKDIAAGGTVRYTCASDGVTAGVNGCITNNPLFMDQVGAIYKLKALSPCINVGDNTYAPTNVSPYDLAGVQRIIGNNVDMGAYEGDIAYADASRADDSGDGRSWAAAKKTIQAAVDLVNDDGTVFVTNGTYNSGTMVSPSSDITNRVCVTNAITIQSMNGPYVTIIEGQPGSNGSNDTDAVRGVFLMFDATLNGFTVRNGYTLDSGGNPLLEGCGGGIWLSMDCVVSNCVVYGNSSYLAGGGIYGFSGGRVDSCMVYSNYAGADGGGVYLDSLIEAGTLIRSTVKENQALDWGGGVAVTDGCRVHDCVIMSNSVTDAGGGIMLDMGGVVSNCVIAYNESPYGGGAMVNDYQFAEVKFCTIHDNVASESGGGVYVADNGMVNNCQIYSNSAEYGGGGGVLDAGGQLNSCVIYGNSATTNGGGGTVIYDAGSVNNCTIYGNDTSEGAGGGSAMILGGSLNNCILWSNTSAVASNMNIYREGSAAYYNTCTPDGIVHGAFGCITNDPQLVDGANRNLRIAPSSPCLNAGNNTYVSLTLTPTDAAGQSRIVFSTVDMGAYEIQYLVSTNNGPAAGGNTITLTNGTLGSGADITNIVIGGVSTTNIISQTANSVTFILPANTAGLKDIVVQGNTATSTFANAYTYNPAGSIFGRFSFTGWEPIAGLPSVNPMAEMALISAHGTLYSFAGESDFDPWYQTNAYVYNGSNWTEILGTPLLRKGSGGTAMACAFSNTPWFFSDGDVMNGTTNVYIFDGTNYVIKPGMPTNVLNATAAVYSNRVYIIGGKNTVIAPPYGILTNVFCFDGNSWSEVAGLPAPRNFMMAGTYDGYLYAVGGRERDGDYERTNTYRFNGSDWTEVAGIGPGIETGILDSAYGVLDNGFYVCGGQMYSTTSSNVWKYDGSDWSFGPGLPHRLRSSGSTVHDSKLYIVGGVDGGTISNSYRSISGTGTGVEPSSGSWTGGYQVVITGTNLGNGVDVTNVTLCGFSATSIDSQSGTQVTVNAASTGGPFSGDVIVYSESFGTTVKSNVFTYLAPVMIALGTNGAWIAGEDQADYDKGTRFYPVLSGQVTTNTFGITNYGNYSLEITSWETNGTGADVFQVIDMPSSVDAGAVSNFSVVFGPSTPATYTATVVVASSGVYTPYVLNYAGSCYGMTTNRGPAVGGGSMTITNGMLGNGSDITNVVICGVSASIDSQGADWVVVTLGASSNAYLQITGDVLIQSTGVGNTRFADAYTYERGTNLIYYVDASQADDSGGGDSWSTAKKTIQAAVDLTLDGDSVLVTNGTYDSGGAVTPGYALTNRVCITKQITLTSVNGPEVTVISGAQHDNFNTRGNAAVRGVFMTNGCMISGFSITNGNTRTAGNIEMDMNGGGVWMATNCVASNLIVSTSSAYYGGGAYLYRGGVLRNCLLHDNHAIDGGGAYLQNGGMMESCSVISNAVMQWGAGVYSRQGAPIVGCTFAYNIANHQGGGAFLYGASIHNCLLNDNSALNDGGGAYIYASMANNCTLTGNSTIDGGGAFLEFGTVNNCIVYDNTATGSGNDLIGSAVAVRSTCASDGLTNGVNGCITNSPLFVDSANNDFQVEITSPCVNAGTNAFAPGTHDLAGNTRIMFGTVDMGAYEVQYQLSTNVGPYAGGNSVIITNSNLGDGSDITNVVVGGVAATITGQTEMSVTITMPTNTAGIKDVMIQSTSIGDTPVSKAYTYNGPGSVVSISPTNGLYSGGYQVTINGTNLCNGSDTDLNSVTVCDVTAMVDFVYGTTQIVISVDATTNAVPGDVVVDSIEYGTTIKSNGFEYLKASQTITFGPIAAKTYGDAAFNPGATASSGLTIDYTTSDSAVATNAGNMIYITGMGTCDVVAAQSGSGIYDPADNVTNVLVVNVKEVTVSGAMASNKVYDATVNASLSGGSLVGVESGDTVTLGNTSTGTFAQATAGTNIAVTAYMTLGGADAVNYSLSQPTLDADITAKGLTVSGASASNKIYDATVAASLGGGSLVGVEGGDTVTLGNVSTGTFAKATIGANIAVTSYMTLGGADAGNYSISQPTLNADITAKGLTVSGALASNKVYDATVAADIGGGSLVGVESGDTVTLDNSATGTFASVSVGNAVGVTSYMTLGGTDAGNYTISQPVLSADITARSLVVTGGVAAAKPYDGTDAATISGAGLSGIQGTDTVTLLNAATGTFAQVNAGTNIAVTSYMSIGGADAGNYSLSGQPSLVADINKATQMITFPAISDTFWTNTVYLSASSDSGLAVSFAGAAGPVSVVGTSATFSGVGQVSITAAQAGNGNYEAAPTVANTFNAIGPGFFLLGTNGISVESDAAAALGNGTDFGNAVIGLDVLTNVFAITNSGTAALTISGVTTGGSPSFMLSMTSSVVAASGSVDVPVVFDPQAGGSNAAAFTFSYDGTNSPFVFNVAGFGAGGEIALSTNSLSFSGVYGGSSPVGQTVDMSNAGITAYTYTNVPSVAWLSLLPDTGTVATDVVQTVTNSVVITGLNAGTYVATNSIVALDATNSPQAIEVTLTVAKAEQTISLPAVSDQETTNTVYLAATASSGLPVSFAVGSGSASISGGTNLTFTGAGSVSIVASQAGNSNYNAAASVTNTFTVTKVVASVTFSNLTQTYDGTAKSPTSQTSPTGLTVNVTYDGGGTAPTNAGSYEVIGTVNDVMYQGGVTNTLVVNKASQTIAFPGIPAQNSTSIVGLTAGSTSGGIVSFAVLSGPGSIASGTNLSFSASGTVLVTADQDGDSNWNAAPTVTNSVLVNKTPQAALVFTPASPQAYLTTNTLTTTGGSGTGAVTYAVTDGPGQILSGNGLYVNSGAGVVTVVATKAQDDMYSATATTSLVACARADQTISFPAIVDQAITNSYLLDATASSLLKVSYSVASGPAVIATNDLMTFSATGVVTIAASQAGDTNWNAAVIVTNTFNVYPVLPTVETLAATAIEQTTIDSGGHITFDGGAPILQRGICWALTSNPTMNDFLSYDGEGSGTYGSVARGLKAGETYFIRAYAINEVGTNYGSEISVTTSNEPPTPPVIEYAWTGAEDTYWTNANNWQDGVVPVYSNTAVFSSVGASGNMILLSGERSVAGLTINTNAGAYIGVDGRLLLTNESSHVIQASNMCYVGQLVLGDTAVISNAKDAVLFPFYLLETRGSLSKQGAGVLASSLTNVLGGDINIQGGEFIVLANLPFASTGKLVSAPGTVVIPNSAISGDHIVDVTNASAGSVVADIDGAMRVNIYNGGYESFDFGHNALALGTNSELDVMVSGSGLVITSTYTIARFSSLTGTFGQVNGLTAHTLNYNSNSITLEPTYVWDGSMDNNWSEGLNWTNSPGNAPGEDNDAGFVPSGGTNIVVNLDTNPVVCSIRARGNGTVCLTGDGKCITLTNSAVGNGTSPAIQGAGVVFELACDIRTVPGARINTSDDANTVIRIIGTISSGAGVGNLGVQGQGRVELLGTNTFGSSTNWLEINGVTLFVNGDGALGDAGAGIIFTNSGALCVSNSMTTGRRMMFDGNGCFGTGGSNNTVTVTNVIAGEGTLTVSGDGTVVLTASNLLGGVTVDGGVLRIMGRLNSNGDVEIHNGAILGGRGTIALGSSEQILHIMSGASCAPGASIGTITVDGSMLVDGSLDIEVDATSNDVVAVRDTLELGSNSSLRVTGTPDHSTDYVFATFASRSGSFGSFVIPDKYTLLSFATRFVLAAPSGSEMGTTNVVREGTTVFVDVSVPDFVSWNAVSTSSWITVTSGATGTGDGTVVLTISENDDRERSGTVWIAGMKFNVTQQAGTAVYLDFDGDALADVACYYPDSGTWYILKSSTMTGYVQPWGWGNSTPVAGDYDGDGRYDVAVYNESYGMWYILQSETMTGRYQAWGAEGMVAVPADYDGDGVTDVAVYERSSGNWLILQSETGTARTQAWGWNDAVPVPGDYDGDSKADCVVYHAEAGMWYILQSSTLTGKTQPWGWADAEACSGDFDGDGKTDIAVYWPETGLWNILQSHDGQARIQNWGWNQAWPVPADYDGDEWYDITVYWPGAGTWYIWQSDDWSSCIQSWGWPEAESVNPQYWLNRQE